MGLTQEQRTVGNNIIIALRQGVPRMKLIGSAGTGKTFLASELVKAIANDKKIAGFYKSIYVTAPTNKALAVIKNKIDYQATQFATIHSALKMKRYIDHKTGEVTFKKGYSKNNPFDIARLALVDEVSMLNTQFVGGVKIDKDGTEELIRGYLESYSFPIIYIGDYKQLSPVGEDISPIWTKDYLTFELKEIVRQGEGNPIIELSRNLSMIKSKVPNLINGKGYNYNNNVDKIISDLAEVNGTDEMKYLAHTNIAVDTINKATRIKRYGNPRKIELGETLVFNSPNEEHYTNKEVKVESLEIVTAYAPVPNSQTKFLDGIPINNTDNIKLKFYRVNQSFDIIHESSEEIYKIVVSALRESCKKSAWNWHGYFFFIEQFADIKYNHAITVHKSQGSTYKNAIVNIQNLNFCKEPAQRERLIYTAITRASDLVILNNVR